MKAVLRETKENVQGTNCDRKETGTQIYSLVQKEEINIQQNRMKKQEFKKMRRGLGTSWTTLNIPTSESQECQKKRKSKKLKTYLNI